MNICCFSRVNYWHGIKGGMDLHGRLLAEGLVESGHSVTMISTRHPSGIVEEKCNGVKVYFLPDTVFGSRRNGWAAASANKFFELHRQQPFDLVWSQSFDAFGLASFKNNFLDVPVITILHGCMPQEFKSFMANCFNRRVKETVVALAGLFLTYLWIQRRIILCSDKIVAVSQEVSTSFEKCYGKNFHNKCVVVVNGVDPSLYIPNEKDRMEIRARYGINDEDVLIMAIGRVTREKGFHVALEAVRNLIRQNMKIKFIIAGSGEYLDELGIMVKKFGLEEHVIFTGHVEPVDTTKYYNGSDIVLNPSLTAEGSSLVVLEAMSCGKPVIASSAGGIKSIIVDGRNGFLVKPGNVKNISDKLKIMADSKSLAQAFSVSARKTVLNNFTVDQMIGRTLAVMEEAARKGLPGF